MVALQIMQIDIWLWKHFQKSCMAIHTKCLPTTNVMCSNLKLMFILILLEHDCKVIEPTAA